MKFEEFQLGQVFHTEPSPITLTEIQDFAQKFDPHAYHLDESAAKRSIFGGIVASGMHSMSLINAAWVRLGVVQDDMRGGLGIEARWLTPVRPGDTLSSDVHVIDKRELDPATGLVTLEFVGHNQRGEVWAKVKTRIIVARAQHSSHAPEQAVS